MVMTALQSAQEYDWQTWRLGIMRSFISGGSAAIVGAMTSMGIAPDKFNLSANYGNTIKLMVVMFLFQGGYRMFEFLSLHAIPDKVVVEKKTVDIQPSGDAGGVKVASVTTTTTTSHDEPKTNGGTK